MDKKREAIEIDYTLNHDFMTEAQHTEISMLAPHRVKPYHFKGKTEAQKAEIMHERSIQIREKELEKKQQAEEEKMYAMQMEHQRRQQILEDRKMKKAHRGVMADYMLTQTQQAADAKAKWVDPYAEKGPHGTGTVNGHTGNLKL